jgi:uncharacterized protein (DUF2252 family)
VEVEEDEAFALRLDNTEGAILEVLQAARSCTRIEMLDDMTEVADQERRFVRGAGVRELSKTERTKVERAFKRYLETLSDSKRQQQAVFYDIKDVVGRAGFGIGSAGLPAYNVLIEGLNQALENDVVLSIKQGNTPAVSRFVEVDRAEEFFESQGHRTVVSQRELQVHTDPFLGWTTVDKVGFVVAEVSPYEADLDWDEITEPEQIEPVVELLGRATAKVHCVSDEDSEEDLVDFQTEEAIISAIDEDPEGFVEELIDFGVEYAARTRKDHALFVDAFREGKFDLVSAVQK